MIFHTGRQRAGGPVHAEGVLFTVVLSVMRSNSDAP
jgi:hypothetical protein